jgi:hypothetical protein
MLLLLVVVVVIIIIIMQLHFTVKRLNKVIIIMGSVIAQVTSVKLQHASTVKSRLHSHVVL